jgi:hypothetical protein
MSWVFGVLLRVCAVGGGLWLLIERLLLEDGSSFIMVRLTGLIAVNSAAGTYLPRVLMQ